MGSESRMSLSGIHPKHDSLSEGRHSAARKSRLITKPDRLMENKQFSSVPIRRPIYPKGLWIVPVDRKHSRQCSTGVETITIKTLYSPFIAIILVSYLLFRAPL